MATFLGMALWRRMLGKGPIVDENGRQPGKVRAMLKRLTDPDSHAYRFDSRLVTGGRSSIRQQHDLLLFRWIGRRRKKQ